MKSIKVCEYSRSRSFHDNLIIQDQTSGERSQDQWSSGWYIFKHFKKFQICSMQNIIHTQSNQLLSDGTEGLV